MHRHYHNPMPSPYFQVNEKAFGASGETAVYRMKGPLGKKGLVRDIMVDVSESMVGTTAVPEVQVGSAAGNATSGSAANPTSAAYARFRLGSTATTGYTTTSGVALRAASMITGAGGTSLSLSDYSSHVQLEKDFIPADTTFFISLTAGVPAAGSVDGSASVSVFIDWL